MISLGPVSLARDLEEKGDYMGRDLSWGVNNSSHRLGIPVLVSYRGETNPLGYLEGLWDQQGSWRKHRLCEEGMHAGFPPRQCGEGGLKTPLVLAEFPATTLVCTPA